MVINSAQDMVIKQRFDELASVVAATVEGPLEQDSVLTKAAPGLGNNQDLMNKIVEQAHTGFDQARG